MEKQSLQQQKTRLEQELVDMQGRFQTELRQTEEATNKLRMDIAFKETQLASQEERLQAQMARELAPLRERLARLAGDGRKRAKRLGNPPARQRR